MTAVGLSSRRTSDRLDDNDGSLSSAAKGEARRTAGLVVFLLAVAAAGSVIWVTVLWKLIEFFY